MEWPILYRRYHDICTLSTPFNLDFDLPSLSLHQGEGQFRDFCDNVRNLDNREFI